MFTKARNCRLTQVKICQPLLTVFIRLFIKSTPLILTLERAFYTPVGIWLYLTSGCCFTGIKHAGKVSNSVRQKAVELPSNHSTQLPTDRPPAHTCRRPMSALLLIRIHFQNTFKQHFLSNVRQHDQLGSICELLAGLLWMELINRPLIRFCISRNSIKY